MSARSMRTSSDDKGTSLPDVGVGVVTRRTSARLAHRSSSQESNISEVSTASTADPSTPGRARSNSRSRKHDEHNTSMKTIPEDEVVVLEEGSPKKSTRTPAKKTAQSSKNDATPSAGAGEAGAEPEMQLRRSTRSSSGARAQSPARTAALATPKSASRGSGSSARKSASDETPKTARQSSPARRTRSSSRQNVAMESPEKSQPATLEIESPKALETPKPTAPAKPSESASKRKTQKDFDDDEIEMVAVVIHKKSVPTPSPAPAPTPKASRSETRPSESASMKTWLSSAPSTPKAAANDSIKTPNKEAVCEGSHNTPGVQTEKAEESIRRSPRKKGPDSVAASNASSIEILEDQDVQVGKKPAEMAAGDEVEGTPRRSSRRRDNSRGEDQNVGSDKSPVKPSSPVKTSKTAGEVEETVAKPTSPVKSPKEAAKKATPEKARDSERASPRKTTPKTRSAGGSDTQEREEANESTETAIAPDDDHEEEVEEMDWSYSKTSEWVAGSTPVYVKERTARPASLRRSVLNRPTLSSRLPKEHKKKEVTDSLVPTDDDDEVEESQTAAPSSAKPAANLSMFVSEPVKQTTPKKSLSPAKKRTPSKKSLSPSKSTPSKKNPPAEPSTPDSSSVISVDLLDEEDSQSGEAGRESPVVTMSPETPKKSPSPKKLVVASPQKHKQTVVAEEPSNVSVSGDDEVCVVEDEQQLAEISPDDAEPQPASAQSAPKKKTLTPKKGKTPTKEVAPKSPLKLSPEKPKSPKGPIRNVVIDSSVEGSEDENEDVEDVHVEEVEDSDDAILELPSQEVMEDSAEPAEPKEADDGEDAVVDTEVCQAELVEDSGKEDAFADEAPEEYVMADETEKTKKKKKKRRAENDENVEVASEQVSKKKKKKERKEKAELVEEDATATPVEGEKKKKKKKKEKRIEENGEVAMSISTEDAPEKKKKKKKDKKKLAQPEDKSNDIVDPADNKKTKSMPPAVPVSNESIRDRVVVDKEQVEVKKKTKKPVEVNLKAPPSFSALLSNVSKWETRFAQSSAQLYEWSTSLKDRSDDLPKKFINDDPETQWQMLLHATKQLYRDFRRTGHLLDEDVQADSGAEESESGEEFDEMQEVGESGSEGGSVNGEEDQMDEEDMDEEMSDEDEETDAAIFHMTDADMQNLDEKLKALDEDDESEDEDYGEEEIRAQTSNEQDSEAGPQETKKKYRKTPVDDKFFSLRQMEEVLDAQEREEDEKGESHEHLFNTEQDWDGSADYNYEDFFGKEDEPDAGRGVDAKKKRKKKDGSDDVTVPKKKSKTVRWADGVSGEEEDDQEDEEEIDEDEHEDAEVDEEESGPAGPVLLGEEEEAEPESKLQKRIKTIKEQIAQLEAENLEPRSWELQGEVQADQRGRDELLEKHVQFDSTAKKAPLVTEDFSETLEGIIKQRIKDKLFDDVVRVVKQVERTEGYRVTPLEEAHLEKKALADVYEKEYMKSSGAAATEEAKENPLYTEINEKMDKLFATMDSLAHYEFAPPPVRPEIKVVNNMAAVRVEEVGAMASTDDLLLAPEETKKKIKGDIKATEEMDKTDKLRARRRKKLRQKVMAKMHGEKDGEAADKDDSWKQKSKKTLAKEADAKLKKKEAQKIRATDFLDQMNRTVHLENNGETKKEKAKKKIKNRVAASSAKFVL